MRRVKKRKALVVSNPNRFDLALYKRGLRCGMMTLEEFNLATWQDMTGLFALFCHPILDENWRTVRNDLSAYASHLSLTDWKELQSYQQAGDQWWYWEQRGKYVSFGALALVRDGEIVARTRNLWNRVSLVEPKPTEAWLRRCKSEYKRGLYNLNAYRWMIFADRTPPYDYLKIHVTDENWHEVGYLSLEVWDDLKLWMKEGDEWWYWAVEIPLAGSGGLVLIRNGEVAERTGILWIS